MRAETKARLLVVALFVLLIELLCRFGVINRLTMIPPSDMAVQLVKLCVSGALNAAMLKTFANILIAFLLSVVGGFVAAVLIHASPRLRRALDPYLASYYSVPVFVFYPLLVALFGITRWPLIIIGLAFAIAAMVIGTLNGLDRVPRVLRKLARVQQMGRAEEALLIVLPAAAPYIFTGVRLALTYSFAGVLAGEFILSNGGLGFSIASAYDSFDNNTMYALMLFIVLLAVVLNVLLDLSEERLMARRGRA